MDRQLPTSFMARFVARRLFKHPQPGASAMALLLMLTVAAPRCLYGGPPQVLFDTQASIGCRDVTPSEFSLANPDEKLVEASFQVSALFLDDREDDLSQFFYRIESPRESLRIVDYLPRTTTATDIAGNVFIEEKEETSKTVGLIMTGAYDHLLKGTGTASLGSRDNSTIKYELLPPLETLVGSGTLRRGAGVYFKLKPSPRVSLEGSKQFVLVLRVPKTWRGDVVHLSCRAQTRRHSLTQPLGEPRDLGANRFVVALYAEGDVPAKVIAGDLIDAESNLRRAVEANHREIEKRAFSSPAHKVASLLPSIDPSIPSDWLDRLLFSSPSAAMEDYVQLLPEDVRQEVARYRAAKQRIDELKIIRLSEREFEFD